jgi:serine palmitoyltransferase
MPFRFRKSKKDIANPRKGGDEIEFTGDMKKIDDGVTVMTPSGLTEASSRTSASNSCSGSETDSCDTDPKGTADPYTDVRDRMEALSLHSRMVHAYHTEESSSADFHGEPVIPFFAAWTTYLGYAVLIFVGHFRDFCAKIFRKGRYLANKKDTGCPADDFTQYAPLLKSFENFYTKRLYHRIQDCFNRPLASTPGAKVNVLERISSDGNKTMQVLGKLENLTEEEANVYTEGEHYATVSGDRVTRNCLNLGSYNYLGFADDWNITCRDGVLESLEGLPVSMGSSRVECGTSKVHAKVEKIVSDFVGKEDAMVVNMGFNTNATTIPALMGRGDLIVSDELNHTSIVNGARTSGSAIRCFRHNDTKNLEEVLKEAIVLGQPRTRRPWKRIMVIVEGIYSMEGEYCDLRNVVKVCKEYGAYVYLDEAHSIGAMGPTGRGCCEYTGVDPEDVDILMGTFTKSFGAMGGYIAGSKETIDYLRSKCAASSFHNSLSPVVCQQIISSFEVSSNH